MSFFPLKRKGKRKIKGLFIRVGDYIFLKFLPKDSLKRELICVGKVNNSAKRNIEKGEEIIRLRLRLRLRLRRRRVYKFYFKI
jgi:hypothetical protein